MATDLDWIARAAEALADGPIALAADAGQVRTFGVSLTLLSGPFAARLALGEDLVAACRVDPLAGAGRIESALAETLRQAETIEPGDGFWYVLAGASAEWASPMEYGGTLLEADRAVLAALAPRGPVCLAVQGEEPYFDALVDLPAAVRVWVADGQPVARPWP